MSQAVYLTLQRRWIYSRFLSLHSVNAEVLKGRKAVRRLPIPGCDCSGLVSLCSQLSVNSDRSSEGHVTAWRGILKLVQTLAGARTGDRTGKGKVEGECFIFTKYKCGDPGTVGAGKRRLVGALQLL